MNKPMFNDYQQYLDGIYDKIKDDLNTMPVIEVYSKWVSEGYDKIHVQHCIVKYIHYKCMIMELKNLAKKRKGEPFGSPFRLQIHTTNFIGVFFFSINFQPFSEVL